MKTRNDQGNIDIYTYSSLEEYFFCQERMILYNLITHPYRSLFLVFVAVTCGVVCIEACLMSNMEIVNYPNYYILQ